MKKVLFKELNLVVELKEPITSVFIENIIYFRNVVYNPYDELIFSSNNQIDASNKCISIIKNPLDISLNDKKIISSLYKQLVSGLTDYDLDLLTKIEQLAINLFKDIGMNSSALLDYSEAIDVNKFFNSFDLRFKDIEVDNYLELLTTFIRLSNDYNKTEIFISYGLLNVLTIEEKNLLNKELDNIGVYLLDIDCVKDNHKSSYYIDEDCCII